MEKLKSCDSGFLSFKSKTFITSGGAHEYTIIAEVYGDSYEAAKERAERFVKCVNLHQDILQKLDDWDFELQSILENCSLSDSVRAALKRLQTESQQLIKKANGNN